MPVPTNFGLQSFEAFALLPSTFTTDYSLWRNTEGQGTTVINAAIPGTGDLVINGVDKADIWSASNRLFGDASLSFPGDASKDFYGQSTQSSRIEAEAKTRLSIMMWIRPNAAGETNQGHIINDVGQFRMFTTAAGAITVEMITTGGTLSKTSSAFLVYGSPEWHFIGFTYDSATTTAKLFYANPDDAAITTDYTDTTTFSGTFVASASDIFVGDKDASGGFQFSGLIAEIIYVPGKLISEPTSITDAFTRPWLYMTQRPMAPWGDGLRTNVLMQRTADGDVAAIQIAPSLPELRRRWDAMNDIDRAAFYTYFRDVLLGGSKIFYLKDTLDFDSDTERKVRFLGNPFADFVPRQQNASPMAWDLVEVG